MKILSWLFCLSMIVLPARAETINVAAASDLSFALQEIIGAFEHETGHQVHLTLGSSGNFYAQIVNGAPFEVFLSADMDYPKQLEAKGYVVPGSNFAYVLGENVSQAAQFVQSRAADMGIIALSLAVSAPMREKGRYWVVPADLYPLLEQ